VPVPSRRVGVQLRASLSPGGGTEMATLNEGMVGKLNSFLRGEISAVETYRQALEKISDPSIRSQLEQCEQDHEQRIELLRERILALGGTPDQGSGAWGVWAKLVQGGGNLLGEKTALQALEEGEDHGLNDYRRDLDELDGETRSWVESNILDRAKRTHGALGTLKRTVH
jgi:demethoxyubiquinone hydroxylase (CLK1/Coq7/Cat5 family)